ncbi:Bile acid-sodium symporter/arsenical resistance protein [Trema orientale]|uniref:Bile acid-sodium symporter/arsenical resistance protein n=1 Tax=Trema orientale TaxID=63057 RepID=A0A2P5EEG4_TREOI|nr:Bile acid-sodium symporter/arsenical resistance protein [Trema orientale]
MPAFGAIISRILGLSPSLSVGLILLGCCPGGTASNVVTLIAQGDVPLSIVMTVCTTLGAVILTPLLTKILAGTYVPVDAAKLSISTLQVVVAPILLGSYIQSTFPGAVKVLTPFAPLFAVLTSSLLACSVFSENVVRLKSSVLSASLTSDMSLTHPLQALSTGELGVVILSVLLLHFFGFFVGYISAALGGFTERERRAISIEVGMQNSSLGVVLATSHFTSPMVALPAAMSAVIMNIMGSSLGFFWRYVDPSDSKNK